MSFAFETKKELCKIELKSLNEMKAEAYGFLLFAKKFNENEITLKTENIYVANRFIELLLEVWQVICQKETALTGKRNSTNSYTVKVIMGQECKKIYEDLGHSKQDISLKINRAFVSDENEVIAFLRGAFLSSATVTDPIKNYHLEFLVYYQNLCNSLCKLFSESMQNEKELKVASRNGTFKAYLKDSTEIAKFLKLLGANNAGVEVLEQKNLKHIRNYVNRTTNYEMANIEKTVKAGILQVNAIEKIINTNGINSLPEQLREIALIRKDNPEATLKDIGEMLNPPISKSGVNHRIKKIMEIAENISE